MMQEEVKEHLKKMKRSVLPFVLKIIAPATDNIIRSVLQVSIVPTTDNIITNSGPEAKLQRLEARCQILAAEPQGRIHIRENTIQITKAPLRQNEPNFA